MSGSFIDTNIIIYSLSQDEIKQHDATFQRVSELPFGLISSVKSVAYLAPRPGLEPGTNGLTVRCSTN